MLAHLNAKVGQCKVGDGSFLHICIQHEHSPGVLLAHQYVHVGAEAPIGSSMFIGLEDAFCNIILYEVYRSALGAVIWTVLTSAELAVYVQSLQRHAHAPRIKDCKRFNLVIRQYETGQVGPKASTFAASIQIGRSH